MNPVKFVSVRQEAQRILGLTEGKKRTIYTCHAPESC